MGKSQILDLCGSQEVLLEEVGSNFEFRLLCMIGVENTFLKP